MSRFDRDWANDTVSIASFCPELPYRGLVARRDDGEKWCLLIVIGLGHCRLPVLILASSLVPGTWPAL